ncbi:MAG: T9SS type A sorting domain-containing protein, partial [Rhodothermales bacterium]|nr:T9SS type A sorting domain-containing protein [Rhodothermales bacterium]
CTTSDSFAQVAAVVADPGIEHADFVLMSPDRVRRGQRAQLFVRLSTGVSDGIRFRLPAGSSVVEVRAESFQSGPIEHVLTLSRDRRSGNLLFAQPLPSKTVVVITFSPQYSTTDDLISVTPIGRASGETIPDYSRTVTKRLAVVQPRRTSNEVLEVQRGRPVLELEDPSLRDVYSESPFSLALWVRSTDLGGVVLSSWTGAEEDAYPLELVIGRDGSAVFYRGKSGNHQSMRSVKPIADGAWHHVAVTNDPGRGRTILFVDGVATDSLMGAFQLPLKGLRLMLGGRVPPEIGDQQPNVSRFEGVVDDAGFWTDRLRAEDVARLARRSTSGVMSPEIMQRFTRRDREEGRLPSHVSLLTDAIRNDDAIASLSGKLSEGSVELSWRSTDSESYDFAVQRSKDGISFDTIALVVARGDRLDYSYRDSFIDSEVLYYRIVEARAEGDPRKSAVLKLGVADPLETTAGFLKGNAPNPFTGSTNINYEIPERGHVQISVWDLSGQPVQTLVDAQQGPGVHEIQFVAGDLPAGTYIVRMQYGDRLESAKILLVK